MAMRIQDSGSSPHGSGSGKKGNPGPSDRARTFRGRHRVGERVQGRLLRWEGPGLAWVDIQGQELLARLLSAPCPGQALAFLVVQLYPDIILQVLSGAGGRAGASLASAIHAFWTARSLFESLARPLARAVAGAAEEKRTAFHRLLLQAPEALARYAGVLGAVQEANAFLQPAGHGRLAYPAWLLLPRALAGEVLSCPGQGGLTKVTASFALPRAGQCLVRLLARPGPAASGSCRAAMERPQFARALDAALDEALAGVLPGEMARLRTRALPPDQRSGLLAGLLQSGGDNPTRLALRV